MKIRTFIPVATIIFLIGCDTKQLSGPELDVNYTSNDNVVEVTSIQDLVKVARQLEANIPKEVLRGQTMAKSDTKTHDPEIAKILDPLKKVGLNVRNQMSTVSQESKIDLNDLNNLTEQELVFLGILHILLEDQGQTIDGDLNQAMSKAYELSSDPITFDDVTSCVISAIGLEAAHQLIVNNVALNADDVLNAAKKLGKRTLGWVGAAIFLYELVTCLE